MKLKGKRVSPNVSHGKVKTGSLLFSYSTFIHILFFFRIILLYIEEEEEIIESESKKRWKR